MIMNNLFLEGSIGFIGNHRYKYTETDAKMMGDYFRQLRSFRKELLREPTEIEHKQIIREIQNVHYQGKKIHLS